MSQPTDLGALRAWRNRFAPGSVFASKYYIDRVLDEDDVAIVLTCDRRDLQQRTVVRILPPELAARESLSVRFLSEARRAATLRSDHAVRILDVGRLDSGEPFIVSEYLERTDLAAAIREQGALSTGRATELVAQACDVVAEAHGHGWVHGELKPSNLLLAKRTRGPAIVKVSGFGLFHMREAIQRLDGGATPARVVGSGPLYVAPEQLEPNATIDARADVWALGAILYELIVGRAPFQGESLARIIQLVASGAVEPPSHTRRDLPQVIDDIVLTCLNKHPEKRYRSAKELLDALEDAAVDNSETSVVELGAGEDGGPESKTEVKPFVRRQPEKRPSSPRPRANPGAIPRVTAPTLGEEGEQIPSVATDTDPSSRQVVVRRHPLAVDQLPPESKPVALWLTILVSVGVAMAILALLLVLAR